MTESTRPPIDRDYQAWKDRQHRNLDPYAAFCAGYAAGTKPATALYQAVADFIATGEERAYATVMLAFRNYPEPE